MDGEILQTLTANVNYCAQSTAAVY